MYRGVSGLDVCCCNPAVLLSGLPAVTHAVRMAARYLAWLSAGCCALQGGNGTGARCLLSTADISAAQAVPEYLVVSGAGTALLVQMLPWQLLSCS